MELEKVCKCGSTMETVYIDERFNLTELIWYKVVFHCFNCGSVCISYYSLEKKEIQEIEWSIFHGK